MKLAIVAGQQHFNADPDRILIYTYIGIFLTSIKNAFVLFIYTYIGIFFKSIKNAFVFRILNEHTFISHI
jgi:hypothetical protein